MFLFYFWILQLSGYLRNDVDRCWRQPSPDMSFSRRGIRPAGDTSTYRRRDVRYGHSWNYDNVHGVQHYSITPGQRRHVIVTTMK